MVAIGDKVRVSSRRVGSPPRDGVVIAADGPVLRVKWTTGEESSFVPGPGSVTIVRRVRTTASRRPSGA